MKVDCRTVEYLFEGDACRMPLLPPGAAEAPEPSSAGEGLAGGPPRPGWPVPVPVQAEALRALERAASMHTAAHARALAAFCAQRGFEDDGQGSPRVWLTWQARITAGAARAEVGWMRRLGRHPDIAGALADG